MTELTVLQIIIDTFMARDYRYTKRPVVAVIAAVVAVTDSSSTSMQYL